MNITDLITLLSSLLDQYGDIEVVTQVGRLTEDCIYTIDRYGNKSESSGGTPVEVMID